MAGEDCGVGLPRRTPGVAWTGSRSSFTPVIPVLSPEVRQCIQAAVEAERAQIAARRQERAVGDLPTDPPGWVPARRSRAAAEPGPAARPQPGRWRRRTGARLVAAGLAIIVTGSLAAAAVRPFSRPSEDQEAVRAQAAAWVAEQVSPDATVSCDAVMCAALKVHGFPARELVTLGPASPDPVPSDLVVVTATVRALFGSSLTKAWAPAVLASFGSGTGLVTVRVVAPHGAAAQQASLHADLAARKKSGAALLNNSRITVSATARHQLMAGQTDMRLVAALASLVRHQPIKIVRFEGLGPAASPSVALRFADLAGSVPAAHLKPAAYLHVLWAILSTADPAIRPARALFGTLQGRPSCRFSSTRPARSGRLAQDRPGRRPDQPVTVARRRPGAAS